MVGIPSFKNAATIGYVVRAAQAGLVQYFPDLRPVLVNSDAGSPDGTGRVVDRDRAARLRRADPPRPPDEQARSRVSLTYPEIDGVGGKGAALRTIFEIAAALEVQALVVVDSRPALDHPRVDRAPRRPDPQGRLRLRRPALRPLQVRRHDHEHRHLPADPGALRPPDPPADRRRLRRVSGDLVRHYLELDDWTDDISKFGIDIWMTTSALTGGFAVCQARLGAKVHDPKDPGSDLGPMFRQVVGTILRLAATHPDHWLADPAAATTSRPTASSGSSTRRRSR